MKKLLPFSLLMIFGLISVFAQDHLNMTLISNVSYPDFVNDIWGYVDEDDGTEYAIMGTRGSTVIYSLSDPANPVEVANIPGASSIWRDMKSFGNYVYVVADQGADGLLVINMANAPDNITWEFWRPTLMVNGQEELLEACHNIYIDENGFGYLAGCNLNDGGLLILDLGIAPGTPIYTGAADPRYSHDVYVKDNIAYSSDIFSGFFSVIDVADKEAPVTLATQNTSSTFTHNAWSSDDGNYLFTTDETGNANVDAYDISDFNNIKRLDTYRPKATEGLGVVPHNTHYHQGYLVTSWYTDGVVVVDAHRPENLIQTGIYDTYLGGHGGTSGCWGAYPFLPSGLILATDSQSGLFVLQPNYVRACYLEGKVTDAVTGNNLFDAEVEILSDFLNSERTNNIGDYKTGQPTSGTFDVQFSKLGYETKVTEAILVNGEITLLDVELQPLQAFNIIGQTVLQSDGSPLPNASVRILGEGFSFSTTADNSGNFLLPNIYEGAYTIVAGEWGYLHTSLDLEVPVSQGLTIELEEGYQDDFVFDLDWEVTADAGSGNWELGEPIGTSYQGNISNPDFDVDSDLGDWCYVTGNGGGGAGTDDVDDGTTVLTSPSMDLSDYLNPSFHFYVHFLNEGGNGEPDDFLEIRVSNGIEEEVLTTIASTTPDWTPMEFEIAQYIEITDDMKVVFETSDFNASQDNQGHLVEAALDAFRVEEGSTGTTTLLDENIQIDAFPNPAAGPVNIRYTLGENRGQALLSLHNILGQKVYAQPLDSPTGIITINEEVESGIYMVRLEVDGHVSKSLKVVKQ